MRQPRLRRASTALLVTALAAGFLVAASGASHAAAARTMTLSLSKTDVRVGETVTLSGRVTRTPRGAKVLVERRSGSSWRTVATVRTTSASGTYRWTLRPRSKGETVYRTRVGRTSSAKPAISPTRRVRAFATASAAFTREPLFLPGPSEDGHPPEVSFAGRVRPFAPGTKVVLERRTSQGWVDDARGEVDQDGDFTLGSVYAVGTYEVRARVARTSTFIATTTTPSAQFTVDEPPSRQFESAGTPTVTGPVRVGETVRAEVGEWVPTPTGYDFEWLRDGEPLEAGSQQTYTVTPEDLGHRLSVRVTGHHRPSDATATRTSVETTVAPGEFSGPGVSMSGAPQVGETLTASAGSFPKPDQVTWQWWRDGAPVPGATRAEYTTTSADLGRLVTVEAVATRNGYATRTTRAPQARVTAAERVAKVSGRITRDTTWSPAAVETYLVDGSITVDRGVTLTIQPGTVVKTRRTGELVVEGRLTAQGTSARPVVLTSWLDDTVGVDVSVESQAPGIQDWSALEGATSSVVDLTHTELRHVSHVRTDGSLSFVDSDLASAIGLRATADTDGESIRVTGSSLSAVQRYTAATLNRHGADRGTPGSLVASGNAFVGGLVVTSSATGTVPNVVMKDNTVRSAAIPFTIRDENLRPSTLTGNTFSDATVPAFHVGGRLVEDLTLRPSDVPRVNVGLRVEEGVTLTLTPGAVLKSDLGAELSVSGTLVAEAATGERPVLTSVLDDSIGARLRGSYTVSPRLGSWAGVTSSPRGTLRFLRADVRFAGIVSSYGDLTLRGSTVRVQDGVYAAVHTAAVEVRIADNDIGSETSRAVQVVRSYQGADAGVLDVTSNTLTGGIGAYSTRTATTAPLVIRGNRLRSSSQPLAVTDAALRPTNLLDNTYSDGGRPVVALGGRLVESWTVPTSGAQFVIPTGDLKAFTVDARATLTVPSGAVLKIEEDIVLQVEGSLDVRGTSTSPAILTSVYDATVGAKAVPPDFRRAPKVGDWSGIEARDGATLRFEHADVRYPSGVVSQDAAFSFVDSRLDSGDGLSAVVGHSGRNVLVTRSTVRATDRRAAVTVGRSYAREGSAPGSLTVTGNSLVGGIVASSPWRTPTTPMVVRDNTVRTAQIPVVLVDDRLVPSNVSGNTFTDASVPAVHVSGRLAESWTVGPSDPPVVVEEDRLTVLPGITLTLRPGTVMKFRAGSALEVEGQLVAEGTTAAPIVLTSWLDRSVGVDVARGSTSEPQAGDWYGVVVRGGGSARLRDVDQRYVYRPTG